MRGGVGVERAGLIECWTELLLASVAVRSPWRQQYLAPTRLHDRSILPDDQIRSTLQLLDRAATLHLKRISCLERSAAAVRILRRRRVPAELRLGVRRSDAGSLEAHAWIELDGTSFDNSLATGFAPLEKRPRRRRLAGVSLVSDFSVPLPDDGTESDVDCVVLVGPPPAGQAGEWHRLPVHPDGGQAWVRQDGRSVALERAAGDGEALGALLRWAVPFASALQGRVILHASAVSRGRGAWAFVGESGAGKSTLARALSWRGWSGVADDLLPCREGQSMNGTADKEGGTVFVLGGRQRHELRAVFFIERTALPTEPRAERLPPAEALHRFLRHGFGELEHEPIWRLQFAFYGTLAERVAAYRLEMPDDLDRVADVASFLERSIEP